MQDKCAATCGFCKCLWIDYLSQAFVRSFYKDLYVNFCFVCLFDTLLGDDSDGASTTESPATTTETTATCADNKATNCKKIKADGNCDKWKKFTKKNCEATCGFCKCLQIDFPIWPILSNC